MTRNAPKGLLTVTVVVTLAGSPLSAQRITDEHIEELVRAAAVRAGVSGETTSAAPQTAAPATADGRPTVKLTLDKPWNIGLIVGPSGAGKSTVAGEIFGKDLVAGWPWSKDKAVIDDFPADLPVAEITALLSSVGFSSPPSWLKPFHVLSGGEQFRIQRELDRRCGSLRGAAATYAES